MPVVVGRALLAILLVAACMALGAGASLAQAPNSPDPATPPPDLGGPIDPRSDGQGPGLDAGPLVVLAGVIVLGVVAAAGTLVVVRLTRED